MNGQRNRDAVVLELARQRGLEGDTFATADELRTPGYNEAFAAGQKEAAERWTLKAGDRVLVYHDPVTRVNPEGVAVLVKRAGGPVFPRTGHSPDEWWNVRFAGEPGEPLVLRRVAPSDRVQP